MTGTCNFVVAIWTVWRPSRFSILCNADWQTEKLHRATTSIVCDWPTEVITFTINEWHRIEPARQPYIFTTCQIVPKNWILMNNTSASHWWPHRIRCTCVWIMEHIFLIMYTLISCLLLALEKVEILQT